GGGIVAVAEEDKLGLIFIPGKAHIFAFAIQQRGGRGGVTGLRDEDSVLSGIARAHRVDDLLAVVGKLEFHHVGDGALRAIGQIADHHVGAELWHGTTTRTATRRPSATAATALLIVLL